MSLERVVLDFNIVISAFLFGGNPARVLGYIIDGSVESFISLPIMDEVRDVLQRPKFGLTSEQALSFVEELHGLCHVVAPRKKVRVIKDDPADNRVLECALEAKAYVIISGDSHLLTLKRWRDIDIISPSDFVHRQQLFPSGRSTGS